MTLVIAAVAVPMLLIEDKTLWASRRRPLGGWIRGGTMIAWIIAALLYLLAFVTLFWLIHVFW